VGAAAAGAVVVDFEQTGSGGIGKIGLLKMRVLMSGGMGAVRELMMEELRSSWRRCLCLGVSKR
jgi:hypothetical protein